MLTADVVTGSYHRVPVEQLPTLIKAVYQTFPSAGSSAERPATNQSVGDRRPKVVALGHLVCLVRAKP